MCTARKNYNKSKKKDRMDNDKTTEPITVSYVLAEGADPKFSPTRQDRADGRQDTGWDVKAYSIEYSKRTHHGKLDTILKVLTFGLYKPVPCWISVDTGISLQADDPTVGFSARMNSRSSKRPFILGNAHGTIDPGYTGHVHFIFNTLGWATWDDINEYFMQGAVIGQLIPERQVPVDMQRAILLLETSRQTGGFGSTEKVRV